MFNLQFESQYWLASTFLRLQEFYESPFQQIRGRYFSLEEYMDIYAEETGEFSYLSDWAGFNVPDYVVRAFFLVFWQDLLEKEKVLYKEISPLLMSNKKFYLIGSYCDETKAHEIAHGYFYLYPEYRNLMINEVKSLYFKDAFKQLLLEKGYTEEVIDDEIQAYLSADGKDYVMEEFGFSEEWEVPPTFSSILLDFENRMKKE